MNDSSVSCIFGLCKQIMPGDPMGGRGLLPHPTDRKRG